MSECDLLSLQMDISILNVSDWSCSAPTIQKEIDGEVKNVYVPGVKIGDGQTYVQDLPFVDAELRETIMNHINNQDIHVTLQEKLFWNNKLNVDDNAELVDGALVLNRN